MNNIILQDRIAFIIYDHDRNCYKNGLREPGLIANKIIKLLNNHSIVNHKSEPEIVDCHEKEGWIEERYGPNENE